MELEAVQLIPIHLDMPGKSEIRQQCCDILNDEWPRSEAIRCRMLDSSRDELPTSLALAQWFSNKCPTVLGHVRLSPIPNEQNAVWLESVVVHPDLRGKGWGKYLMLRTEQFCKTVHKVQVVYLSTIDQQIFYARCGYEPCDPVCAYSGNVKIPRNLLSNHELSTEVKTQTSPLKKNSEHVQISSSTSTAKSIPLPLPPPPPPPPTPSASAKPPSSATEDETIEQLCRKFLSFPKLEDLSPLEKPLRCLKKSVARDPLTKEQICRAVVPKTYMRKLIS